MISATNPLLMLLSSLSQSLELHSRMLNQGQEVNTLMSQLTVDSPNPQVTKFLELYRSQFFDIIQKWSRHQFTRDDLQHAQAIVVSLNQLLQNESVSDSMVQELWPWSNNISKKWLLAEVQKSSTTKH